MSDAAFVGIAPIVLVPFDEHEHVAFECLENELNFLAGLGLTWVGFGFGSEIFRLTESELDEVVRFTSDVLKGRARVFASVRAGSTKAAALRAEALSRAGADALMMPVPPYATVPQGELLAVYRSVAEACALGLVVQDAPAMSGVELSIDVLQRIVDEVPNVLALKIETPASAAKISRLVELLDGAAPVFGGNGGLDFYRELERGASGTMPSAAYPDIFMRIWESFVSGDSDESRAAHGNLLPLLTLSQRDLDTFLWTEKEILRRRGVIRSARLRAPSQEASPGLRDEVAAELERLIQLGLIGQPLGTI